MNNLLNGKSAAMMLALSLVNVTAAFAQDDNSSAKEEGNRNVMLNAASANGPREIQIGLPSADVNVLENGLPVTYATNPHSVNTIWRGDASLSHQGLLKIAETAITTGNIGYAVNSFTQKGQKGFNGTLNYKSNHFGLQEFSLNMNGDLGKDWYYSFNIIGDLFFVLFLGWGSEGCAVATVLSEALSCILCIIYIQLKVPVLQLGKKWLIFDKKLLGKTISYGWASAMQQATVQLGKIGIQAIVNTMGVSVSAAFAVVPRHSIGTRHLI